ncbi:imidazole glycerol phosphate synthase subunit HisH [Sphingosinicella rhizophila]|uniref:Imidazole glycerol phosphate synthase subunit HisH n=1 Tax=Sphingosinicella rhizophila TaxID=3050082 RepID=A0ABU3Q896_9SPHN|nr:imidazole glycerol phosphate synthase subunit HisH [Sphingosinicella sp. GR2756]MDT9599634.1 imidazole glycerol phosphate synthase subunit HisH [Sphingosinicella sp. GR2756]
MTTFLINSSIGNVRSIASMMRRIGQKCETVDRPVPLSPGDRLILPGVGSFDAGMIALRQTGLDAFVREGASLGCDLLGICLGMHLLCDGSEEGQLPGLGLVPATVRKLPAEVHGLRLPHMGWNVVRPTGPSLLFDPGGDEQRFYFVHSFYVDCEMAADRTASCDYGIEFACAFQHGRIMGVQFHPEKSHRFGMALLDRFMADRQG